MTAPARPGCWTWSRAAPSRRSRPGSPTAPQAWRDAVEVVAMDGFTGFKTATTEELPDAVAVMDPFHVVRLAGDALDRCRRRVQQDHPRPPRPQGRPALLAPGGPCTPAPTCSPTSRRTGSTDPVRRRRARRGRGHLGHLPADDRRLPRTRPDPRPRADAAADRLAQPRRPGRAERGHHPRPDPEEARRRRAGLLRPARHQPTAPPRRSTADSNTSAAPPSGSATSPTTSPDPYSRPAASDPDYTLDCEEPG